jgi:hypothetical protein
MPAPIDAAIKAFRSAPALNAERSKKLRRASVRLRALGVPLAVRERFVGLRSALNFDALIEGDPVLAALDVGQISGP